MSSGEYSIRFSTYSITLLYIIGQGQRRKKKKREKNVGVKESVEQERKRDAEQKETTGYTKYASQQ